MVVLAFGIIYVVWGSTFLAIRIGLEGFPPFLMAGFRFVLSGVLLYLISSFVERVPISSFRDRTVWRPIVSGILLAGTGNGILTWSEQRVPSGIASLWIASIPVWILLVNWVWDRKTPPKLSIVGALIGLLGVSVLRGNPFNELEGGEGPYLVGLLIAAMSWAVGTVLQVHATVKRPPLWTSSVQMTAGGIFLLVLGTGCGEWATRFWEHLPRYSVAAVLYLVVFGSVIAFTAYSWLITRVHSQKVSTYALVNPIIALILGATIASERITSRVILSSVLVLSGVACILLSIKPKPRDGDSVSL